MISVVLVDSQPLIRSGLRAILEQEADLTVLAETSSETETIDLCRELSPELVILDLHPDETFAIGLVSSLQSLCPPFKIVILTERTNVNTIRYIASSGVDGCVFKEEAPETLAQAIHAVAEGELWFSRQVIDILETPRDNIGLPTREEALSEREWEVLRLVAKGSTNREIAEMLCIAIGTVKNHLVSIYQKLDLHSRAEAVAWAWEHKTNI